MTGCARSCTIRGKHTPPCRTEDHGDGAWYPLPDPPSQLFDGDHPENRNNIHTTPNGTLAEWRPCRGCKPRPANHGMLCETCHNRLTTWLTGPRGLTWIEQWLADNVPRVGSAAARQDWQRPAGRGAPLPIVETAHDLRILLLDRVYELEDCARDEFDRPARDERFNLKTACDFLHAWLTRIEETPLVLHMYDLLDDVTSKAERAFPWSDRPRRIIGIPCPTCEMEALVIHPGDEDVTCRHCQAVHKRERYEIWTRMLAREVS